MDDRDLALIDRYLAGELTPEESQMADDRRQSDPAFDQSVREMEEAIEALRVYRREELRKQFNAIDLRLDGDNPEPNAKGPGRPIWMWIGLAAAVATLVWLGVRLFDPAPATDQPPVQAIDSLSQGPAAPDIAQPAPKSGEKPKLAPESPPPAQKQKERKPPDGPALFAEYFEPYRDLSMDPDVRGIDDPTSADRFEQLYWYEKYQEAVDTFDALPQALKADDRFRFRYANALLALGEYSNAKAVLLAIQTDSKSMYSREAVYTLALVHIQERNFLEATRLLNRYLGQGNGKNAAAAESLRLKLRQ